MLWLALTRDSVQRYTVNHWTTVIFTSFFKGLTTLITNILNNFCKEKASPIGKRSVEYGKLGYEVLEYRAELYYRTQHNREKGQRQTLNLALCSKEGWSGVKVTEDGHSWLKITARISIQLKRLMLWTRVRGTIGHNTVPYWGVQKDQICLAFDSKNRTLGTNAIRHRTGECRAKLFVTEQNL